MKDLRRITKMITKGRVASKEAVMIRFHWGRNPAPPSKDPIPRVRGKFSGPGDVSVVGFDDIPEASYYAPPLTTVRQEILEVGTLSMAMLLQRLRGEGEEPMKQVVEPDLVLRSSIGPPQ